MNTIRARLTSIFVIVINLYGQQVTTNLVLPDKTSLYVSNQWNKYLIDAITKFVDSKYQDFVCLNYLLFGTRFPSCNMSNFLLPLDTENCRNVRKNPVDAHKFITATTSKELNDALSYNKIQAANVNNILQKFNQIPQSSRTKEQYAEVYKTAAVYLAYAYTDAYMSLCEEKYGIDPAGVGLCILEANKAAFEFFGGHTLPDWKPENC